MEEIKFVYFWFCVCCSIYMGAVKDNIITNAAGGKTICLKKTNFPDTGTYRLCSVVLESSILTVLSLMIF